MKIGRLIWVALVCANFLIARNSGAQVSGTGAEVNVLSLGAGALPVHEPVSFTTVGNWSPVALLDEQPGTGWATRSGDLTPKVFVFELAERSTISSLSFDTAKVERPGCAAKDVKVEISDHDDGGFTVIATQTLAEARDHQRIALKAPVTGRYIRLTASGNYGDDRYIEIMNFAAYGKPLVKRPVSDNSGMFSSSYGKFHVRQTGAAVNGCYETGNGLIENGGFEGRVLRFTWTEGSIPSPRHGGPAIVIFSDDGQSFTGYWWRENGDGAPSGVWKGTRVSRVIGSCPNWKADQNSVEQALNAEGRARLYGILFDTDSDRLKPESKPTLDALVAAARAEPKWSFEIEGHTDNVGGAPHNQPLSEKRALSVKAYLVAAGVDAGRLTTHGFGAGKPVSSNDTELGRSQNRRVEIVKK